MRSIKTYVILSVILSVILNTKNNKTIDTHSKFCCDLHWHGVIDINEDDRNGKCKT